jgi:hypothetical protein
VQLFIFVKRFCKIIVLLIQIYHNLYIQNGRKALYLGVLKWYNVLYIFLEVDKNIGYFNFIFKIVIYLTVYVYILSFDVVFGGWIKTLFSAQLFRKSQTDFLKKFYLELKNTIFSSTF